MGYDDFCRLTPEEIDATLRCRGELRRDESRRAWEIMRLQTWMTIAPFCKNLGKPQQLLPFSWDEEGEPSEPELTAEERKENERRLREGLGW